MDIDSRSSSTGRSLVAAVMLVAGPVPVRTLLICDDRPGMCVTIARELTTSLPDIEIRYVEDGFALVDAQEASPADVVLIGLRNGNDIGINATGLLYAMYPAAKIIVIGTTADMRLLATAYSWGAHGMLLWDPA